MADDHLRSIYVTGAQNRLRKPTALTLLCAQCGTDHHTDGISVADVLATATAHISSTLKENR